MITIRKVPSTHPALRDLHEKTFPGDPHPAYSLGWWWVAFDGKKPVAFAGMQPSCRWSDCVYMARCGVLERYRGRGLQRRLIRVRVAVARGLFMRWVITSTYNNPPSANSLIAAGFRMYDPTVEWAAPGTLYWRLRLPKRIE